MPTSGSSDARARVPIAGRYKVTSSLAVRDALRAGFGLSLIPWIYVKEDIEQGRLRVDLSVYAVYPSRRHGVAKLRAFVDFSSRS
jgi:DNA-binding transcriptional LysR family regulator